MAVEIGTASNARDLVSKLEKFLTTNPELVQANQAWEVIKDSDGDKVVDVDETYDDMYDEEEDVKFGWVYRRRFIGHGLDGQDTIVVPMAMYVNEKYKITSLCAWYATQNDAAKEISTYFAKVKFGNIFTAIPLKNESMNYWFVANGRRFIIVVKVEQYYLSMYCGFMLQFGTDLENTYPMYIGGSHNNNYARIGDEDAGGPIHEINFDYGGFHDPFTKDDTAGSQGHISSCFCNTPNGVVAMIAESTESLGGRRDTEKYTSGYILPYRYITTVSGLHVIYPIEITAVYSLSATINTHVGHWREASTVGWLQGAYFVSGLNNTPEKELVIGDKRYLCFPSMQNSDSDSSSYNRWLALLME